MNDMDLLPPELILKVFGYLPVHDTIRLGLVCKYWYQLTNYLKHQSLTLFHQAMLEDDLNDLTLTKSADWVQCADEDLLLAAKLPPMLLAVRKLSAYFYSNSIINLTKFFNQFERLEELTYYNFYLFYQPIILNLQRLHTLITINDLVPPLDLRTPSLANLTVYSLRSVDLYYPDSLRTLKWTGHDRDLVDLAQFPNLEILIVTGSYSSFITNSFLTRQRNLRELHFRSYTFQNGGSLGFDATYRRPGLKLYAFGFDVDQRLDIVDSEYFPQASNEDVSAFLVRNFDHAAPTVHYPFELEYNVLARSGFDTILPSKFRRLGLVKTNGGVVDEDALLKFLLRTNPKEFWMENELLSSNFLAQFARRCSSIQKLKLKNLNIHIARPEFDFIFQMENLSHIEVYQPISFDFLVRAFESCECLSAVAFEFGQNRNHARFVPSFLFLSLGSNCFIDTLCVDLRPKNRAELCYYLRQLKRAVKLDPKLEDLKELIYFVQNYKANQVLVEKEVRKLVRNEVFHIYSPDHLPVFSKAFNVVKRKTCPTDDFDYNRLIKKICR